ncbi:hypothetical protein IQ235_07855 [Oscillatoriales cyanobacterium LEGE 11467]|uniref:Uncharacterized protein n=1 Tax=Zarconia navalis LEGE 11467 TaxID=1828826 RepID=A0A928VUX2_9CYAN|nr:hypothetical protein [Zarconia navalis LEGE 11467]
MGKKVRTPVSRSFLHFTTGGLLPLLEGLFFSVTGNGDLNFLYLRVFASLRLRVSPFTLQKVADCDRQPRDA